MRWRVRTSKDRPRPALRIPDALLAAQRHRAPNAGDEIPACCCAEAAGRPADNVAEVQAVDRQTIIADALIEERELCGAAGVVAARAVDNAGERRRRHAGAAKHEPAAGTL